MGVLLASWASLLPAAAAAHPLGNFSINHFNGITVTPGYVAIDYVLDMAEIPTFSERAAMDADGDGLVTDGEAAAYALDACQAAASAVELRMAGDRLSPEVRSHAAAFRPGQGAQTLRLECDLRAALARPLNPASPVEFSFSDPTWAERIGWREVVVAGEGAAILVTDALTASVSERLESYPEGMLAADPGLSTATFSASAVAGVGSDGAPVPDLAAAVGSVPEAVDGALVPGIDLAALLDVRDASLPAFLLALAVAFGLGALHALSPGHGKTIMAAYLVGSRGAGGVRSALGLGLVVTVSHTSGVLLLAVLSLGAAQLIPVERLYPILGLGSGLIVVGLGAWLLWGRLASSRLRPAASEQRVDPHGHGHEHEHPHPHEHEHPHPRPHDVSESGWHGHGPFRHQHLPAVSATPGWRGLAALGLAGGMVPSASALILLLGSVSVGRPDLGLVLTIAFGAGMSIVLVGIGIMVVLGADLVGRLRPARSPLRVAGLLPTLAATFVLLAGGVMVVQALVALEIFQLA